MRTLLLFSSMVLLSACGASNEAPDAATADPATVDTATGVAATPTPEPTVNPANNAAVDDSPRYTFDCSGAQAFKLVISDFESSETGTGQVRAVAKYRFPTPSDNPWDIPSTGYVDVNAGGYEFPNGVLLEDTNNEKTMAIFFPDSGDMIECVRP